MRYIAFVMWMMVTFSVGGCTMPSAAKNQQTEERPFALYRIGKVVREGGKTMIVLDEKYTPGLSGLEKHAHVTVVYWFDRNDTPEKRAILKVHPRGREDISLTGVFATHAPVRPNLIAISKCNIISVKGNTIEIEDIDAFDDSPVLDLKGDYFHFNPQHPSR
jgi:tRNA-Thr(GGU) m(6)t(6)A37 methyltransferase TsaA